MATKNVAYYKEKLGELHDKATALVNLAEKEKDRNLTKEEAAEFDGYKTESDEIRETHMPRAEWRESEEKRLAESHSAVGGLQTSNPGNSEGSQTRAITIPAVARRGGRLIAFKGPDAERNAYSSGQFLRACCGNKNAARWCHENGITAALSGDSNPKGGILVPIELERSIIDLREFYGTARQKCRVMPMGSDTTIVPRRASGLTTYYLGENEEVTASDKGWNSVELHARKLAVLSKYSSELAEDSITSIADDLAQEIAYAMALAEDQALFLGNGTSTYGGISGLITECATATATVVTAPTADIAYSDLEFGVFEAMIGKLPEFPGIRPEWYIHKSAYAASMLRLIDAAGGNTIAILEGGPSMREFLGYPVNFVQIMNSTLTDQASTNGLVYFGDLRLATTLGDRRSITIRIATERYIEFDQIGIFGNERYDIQVHDVGDTSVAGAVIMLATPSS